MRIRWNTRAGAARNARARLPELVSGYFALGREIAGREDAPSAELHRFRLATKRLRYTLELFRPCYGPALEKRLGELKSIQQFLGDANDCSAVRRLLPQVFPPASQARKRVERFLEQRAASDAARFRSYWKEQFDRPGRERFWVGYFAGRRRG